MKIILVVDDEESIVDVLKMGLEKTGYKVITAKNGSEAMVKIKEHDINLVITDMVMPGMTGNQLTKQIKNIYNIPIIGISGKPWFLNESLFEYTFTKPFRIKDLCDKVWELLV